MAKYALLREALVRHLPGVRLAPAEAASAGELCARAPSAYVAAVAQNLLTPAQQREIGFPWSPAMAERALRSVGATLQACRRRAGRRGAGGHLAGGTRHGYADKGSGFCVFNDVAVAARVMQAEWGRRGDLSGAGRCASPSSTSTCIRQRHRVPGILGDDSVFTLSPAWREELPLPQGRRATATSACPTAVAMPTTAALEQGLAGSAALRSWSGQIYLAGMDERERPARPPQADGRRWRARGRVFDCLARLAFRWR